LESVWGFFARFRVESNATLISQLVLFNIHNGEKSVRTIEESPLVVLSPKADVLSMKISVGISCPGRASLAESLTDEHFAPATGTGPFSSQMYSSDSNLIEIWSIISVL
jgi:hypothetical protein